MILFLRCPNQRRLVPKQKCTGQEATAVALSTNHRRHKHKQEKPKPKSPGASWRHWKLTLMSTSFRRNTHTAHDRLLCTSASQIHYCSKCVHFKTLPKVQIGYPLFQAAAFWVQSPEGISKWLNSLCLYLYPNDRTLRCKLKRNLVSKSCHFLMDTWIKSYHTVAKPWGKISKAHLEAPGTQCVRNSISSKYLWSGLFHPR